MRFRVVCGLEVTMAIFWPTRRFTRVDFPAFGRPTMATNPDLYPALTGAVSAGLSGTDLAGTDLAVVVLANFFLSGMEIVRFANNYLCDRRADFTASGLG